MSAATYEVAFSRPEASCDALLLASTYVPDKLDFRHSAKY